MSILTKEAISVYKKFEGDADGWIRMGTAADQIGITGEEWSMIDGFIQDLTLIKNGLASEGFVEAVDSKLSTSVDIESTIKELKTLV